jgi:hypothetical protein
MVNQSAQRDPPYQARKSRDPREHSQGSDLSLTLVEKPMALALDREIAQRASSHPWAQRRRKGGKHTHTLRTRSSPVPKIYVYT